MLWLCMDAFHLTDNIDIAKRKLKLAEVTSDLQTEEEDEKPKRKAARTTRFDSSDENDEFNHLRPPPLKKQFVDGKLVPFAVNVG